jgi:hypothetical protein
MIDTLVRAQPLPDEWVRGYAGRVARLNGWSSKSGMTDALLNVKGRRRNSWLEVTLVQLMASIAAMDLSLFLRDHSLFGLWRSAARFEPSCFLGQEKKSGFLKLLGMRPARADGYLCPMCVQEDIGFHGQSYWRREHQLPGRAVCPRHKAPLRCVDLEKVGQLSPAACIQTRCSWECEQYVEVEKEVHVERFLDVCSHLMNAGLATDGREVSRIARLHAHAHGFHTGSYAHRLPYISDRIAETFDATFLDEVFPGLRQNHRGTSWSPIDDAFLGSPTSSTLVYVVVFSYLIQNADQAALAIIKCKPSGNITPPVRKVGRMVEDAQRNQAYLEGGGSHQLVAL